ncbi:endothiapepsin [Sodiomyces alkalinus F11]|uniref:Endothiapepsin n=1 Tax=Sodiomyces alkalinus (strain CBS 110278 / VKM F-3762 / F11) TaxID=1314773 RepID=A0A3N2PUN3_SODAK|nr:endothiapepsin [Sodiomyces alkalinus F11]ROT38202.1 endothiapepsin [Sodiomyces alkalinus F11]
MHVSSFLSCVFALASASPLVHPNSQEATDVGHEALSHGSESSGFTLHQIANERYVEETGLDALLWAYIKYNAELPPRLWRALRIGTHVNARFKHLVNRDDESAKFGTVQAFPPRNIDIQYVVPVQIGMPPQTVFLNLDTGSGDLWTISTDTSTWQVGGHAIYDPRASNTSKLVDNAWWRIIYGDGSGASGIVYTDRVAIGKTFFEQQAVESAQAISRTFTQDDFASGILGLGFGRGNTVRPQQVKTYMENILPSLAAPVFTANLQAGRPGNYNFGFVSAQEHVGPIAYAPVTQQSPYWEIEVDGFQVEGGSFNGTEALSRVIVDTGTTLILVPDELVEAYYDRVQGARFDASWAGYIFPCNASLPDWTFGIADWRGTVPGKFMSYSQVSQTHCFGGIQSSQGIPFAIFGAVLLKSQFVVFDYVSAEANVGAAPRVGFASKPLD